MRIALLDDYPNVALSMADWSRLGHRAEIVTIHEYIPEPDRLTARLADFDAVMTVRERTKFPRAVFERLPRLRLLVTAGICDVAIDLDAATEHGVQVSGTRNWPHPTEELALGLMIALARHGGHRGLPGRPRPAPPQHRPDAPARRRAVRGSRR